MAKKKEKRLESFVATFYLRDFPKELKIEKGIEPKVSDFVEAFHEMQLHADKLNIHSMVCQVERGKREDEMMVSDNGIELMAGTLHLQCYIQLTRQRIVTWQNKIKKHTKFKGAVFKAEGGASTNLRYCTKGTGLHTYADGKEKYSQQMSKPMWINKAAFKDVKKGQRSDLTNATTAILNGASTFDVAFQMPNVWARYKNGLSDLVFKKQLATKTERRGGLIILWGKAGTGKSYTARHSISKQLGLSNQDVFSLAIGNNKNPWFDGYNGEKILLIDDYKNGDIKDNVLLRICDVYPLTPPIKGGHTIAAWDWVIITSNYPPTSLFTSWEYSEELGRNAETIDAAMMSRIDLSIDFSDMPDRRGKTGAYQSVKATPHSVAAILPATLAHGTNESTTHVPDGTMQGCGDAITTEKNTELELAQFFETGTPNATQLDLAHDQIFTTEKEETA